MYADIFREYTKDTHLRIRDYAENETQLTLLDAFGHRAGNRNWRKYVEPDDFHDIRFC